MIDAPLATLARAYARDLKPQTARRAD